MPIVAQDFVRWNASAQCARVVLVMFREMLMLKVPGMDIGTKSHDCSGLVSSMTVMLIEAPL
jgi:hypothetical protein